MASRRSRVTLAVAAFACVVSGLVACASLVVPDIDVSQAPDAEAGTTTMPDTGIVVDSGDPCAHALPPGKPLIDDNPTLELPEMSFIIRETHVLKPFTYDAGVFDGGPSPTKILGFDLDHACTCEKDLKGGINACAAKSTQCDQDGGIDNQLPAALNLLLVAMPNADVDEVLTVNKRIAAGDSAIIITLRGYNGLANDTAVTAVVRGVARPELAANPDGGPQCQVPPGADAAVLYRPPSFQDMSDGEGGVTYWPQREPVFDGCDNWGQVESTPPIEAWVTNHQLVISTTVAVPLQLAGSILNVETTRMTAVLVPDGKGGFTLEDGNAGARAPTAPLLATLSTLRFSIDAGQLCMANPVEQAVLIGQVCNAVDILANSSSDFYESPETGAQVKCDALSVAFAFRGEQANYGVPIDASVVEQCQGVTPPSCN